MKEFRFKILRENDLLCRLTEKEMIIGKPNGDYHIYKISGFDVGQPSFYKKFDIVTIYTPIEPCKNTILIKNGKEFRAYKIKKITDGFPKFDKNFYIIVKAGIGKIEIYDTKTELTVTLPAKASPYTQVLYA